MDLNKKNIIGKADVYGKILKEGDIVAEGVLNSEIWNGWGILISRPLGIVRIYKPTNTACLEPEETDCYNVVHLRTGTVAMTSNAPSWAQKSLFSSQQTCDIYISSYDGRFTAWNNIEVVGNIYDLPN